MARGIRLPLSFPPRNALRDARRMHQPTPSGRALTCGSRTTAVRS